MPEIEEEEIEEPTPKQPFNADEAKRLVQERVRYLEGRASRKTERSPAPTLWERYWCWRVLGAIRREAKQGVGHLLPNKSGVRPHVVKGYFEPLGFRLSVNPDNSFYSIYW